MPILRVKGGYRVKNTPTIHRRKRDALRQLIAIKAAQGSRAKMR